MRVVAKHEEITAALRAAIEDGTLPVGSLLPSEAELSATYSASRGPVRHAMASLRAEGLVESRQGRQTRVAARTARQPVTEFMYFSRFARSIGRTPGARTIDVARRPADATTAAVLDIAPGSPIVHITRLRTLEATPTMLERSSYREDVGIHLFRYDLDGGSITERLVADGVDYATVDQEIDAVSASADDAAQLTIAEGSALLRQRRVARDASGIPFEYADDRYRPDLVTFSIRNSNPQIAP
jgi:GntR family transcriptional regulator